MQRNRIVKIIHNFCAAGSWSERKEIIKINRKDLLSKTTKQILNEWLKFSVKESEIIEVKHIKKLFECCEHEGIDIAFADLIAIEELDSIINKIRSQNEQDSIHLCRRGLELVDRELHSEKWAWLNFILANSLCQTPAINKMEIIDTAIVHYLLASEVYTKDKFPFQWACIQSNLGSAYSELGGKSISDNQEKAIKHYEAALTFYTRNEFAEQWANCQNNLGSIYAQRLRGEKAANQEKAVECHKLALEVETFKVFPTLKSDIQMNLATVYAQRIKGEKADNLEEAIRLYFQALQGYSRNVYPLRWAAVQNNLGNAFKDRIKEDKSKNIEESINHYKNALEVRRRENFPILWAETQNNLGSAYLERVCGEFADNIEQAIQRFKLSLEVRTKQSLPVDWALTLNNLGIAYKNRIREKKIDNLEKAIQCHELSLEILTKEEFRFEWAKAQVGLGTAYQNRIKDIKKENLEKSITHLEQALSVLTMEAFPDMWAIANLDLGNTYLNRIKGDRGNNIELAIKQYELSLKIHTRDAFPIEWARAKNNLGKAYVNRIKGERIDNIEFAIGCFKDALEIRTKDNFLIDWAQTQDNLGEAYTYRTKENIAENLEEALKCYQFAGEVYTRAAFPEQWADLQNDLGVFYLFRIRGERANNLEQAIYSLEQTLEVRKVDMFPDNWAKTHNNLGAAYNRRVHGKHNDNLNKAIEHYSNALTILTKDNFPQQWASIQNNLGVIYSDRRLNNKSSRFELAINHYKSALEIYTREAFPEEWANLQDNLGTTYAERIQGNKEDNFQESVKYLLAALEVYTPEAYPEKRAKTYHNLAGTYAHQAYEGYKDNYEQAVYYFEQALEVRSSDTSPEDRRRTLYNLGELHFHQENWKRAHSSYSEAIALGDDLFAIAYTESGRQAEVKISARMYSRDAYCLAMMESYQESFARFEEGKMRLLVEVFKLNKLKFNTLFPDSLHQELSDVWRSIRIFEAEMRLISSTSVQERNIDISTLLKQARAKLRNFIQSSKIEQQGFSDSTFSFVDVLDAIPENGVMVAPLITPKGCVVFIVPKGQNSISTKNALFLKHLNDSTLETIWIGTTNEPGWLTGYIDWRNDNQLDKWKLVIEGSLQKLWQVMLGPIRKRLLELGVKEGSSILILPQGKLSLLPLQAAWHESDGIKHFFSDYYTVSYAFNTQAAKISQQRVKNNNYSKPNLLVIANPTLDLPYTPIEGLLLKSMFPITESKILCGEDATLTNTANELPCHNYLHFACHGFYNWEDAMKSGLVLAEKEHFTLSKIVASLDLSITRLVTLSACETGFNEFRNLPDEYVGLPGGFLQAGAAAALSSLWAVNDLSSMLLMEYFYLLHLKGNIPAKSLRDAQVWLRHTTAKELTERFKIELDKPDDERSISYELASKAWRQFVRMQPYSRPFESPFYWAAFVLNGV